MTFKVRRIVLDAAAAAGLMAGSAAADRANSDRSGQPADSSTDSHVSFTFLGMPSE
jgi:hypothetical protein